MGQSEGGNITGGQTAAGRAVSWKRGKRLTLRMNSAPWQKDSATMLNFTFRRAENATRITMSLDGVVELFGGERTVRQARRSEVESGIPDGSRKAVTPVGDKVHGKEAENKNRDQNKIVQHKYRLRVPEEGESQKKR